MQNSEADRAAISYMLKQVQHDGLKGDAQTFICVCLAGQRGRRSILGMLALVSLTATAQAQSQPQAMILISTSPGGRELLVDRASLRTLPPRSGYRSFPAAQVRAEIRSPGGRRGGRITERALYSFNCTGRTVATLAYYRGDASGRRSHDWTAADYATRYDPVKPGAAVEIAMTYACSGGKLPLPPAPEEELTPSTDED